MDIVHRLARASLRSGTPLSFDTLVQQIRNTVEVLVFLVRDSTGRRRVSHISEMIDGVPVPRFEGRGGVLVKESAHDR
jgi:hypothetical protein